MKVIDDLLSEKEFKSIQKIIEDKNFPWYFVDGKSYAGDGSYQMSHTFVELGKVISKMYKINYPVLSKLNVHKILRIKANITFKKLTNEQSPMHVDYEFPEKTKYKTAVFYCNTNNGSTLFQNGKRVYSKENRLVVFDGHQKHCGVDCTDKVRRIVINYVYTEKEK